MGYQDRDYYRNRGNTTPYQPKDSQLTKIIKAFIALMFAAIVLWIGRTVFALVSISYLQQTTTKSMQQVGDKAQESLSKIQQQHSEITRKTTQSGQVRSAVIIGYQQIWISGKSSAECKNEKGVIDNAVIACLNGHYATAPVYGNY